MIKSGWRTSEFWLVVAAIIMNLWALAGGLIPADLAVKVIAVMIGAYNFARSIAKITPTKKDDEFLIKLKEIFTKMP